jgi:hypothetical protein
MSVSARGKRWSTTGSGTGVGDDREKVEGTLNLVAIANTLGGANFRR